MKDKPVMVHELDSIDHQIIQMLQKNARISAKEISEKVFLSSTAVAARIERLQQRGIITGFTTQLNARLLGYDIRAFISLELEPRQKEEFYPFAESVPSVMACHCVTGDFAMLLEVAFRDTMELDSFIGELQRFGKTRTMIVFSSPVEYRETYIQNLARENSRQKS